MNRDIPSIWGRLYPKDRLKTKNTKKLVEQYDAALHIIESCNPELAKGKNIKLEPKDIVKLVQALECNNLHDFRRRLYFLYEGIRQGRKLLGWDVPLPSLLNFVRRPRNLTDEKHFLKLKAFEPIEKAFLKSLGKPPQTPAGRIGQILFSAICYGGLLDKSWLGLWLDTLRTNVQAINGLMWFDIRREQGTQERNRLPAWKLHRRWIPDPISQALILAWYRDFPQDRQGVTRLDYETAIRTFLKGLCLPQGTSNTDDVIAIGKARLLEICPGYLYDYAAGALRTVPLIEESWLRLLSGKNIPVEKPLPPTVKEQLSDAAHSTANSNIDLLQQGELLKELSKKIHPHNKQKNDDYTGAKNAIKSFKDQYYGEISPILSNLIEWADCLLNKPPKTKIVFYEKRLKPKTVRRYLDSIATGLLAFCELDDPRHMEDIDLIEMYENAVTSHRSSKERAYSTTPLRSFNLFLYYNRKIPYIDIDAELTDTGDPTIGVKANLISPTIFDNLLKAVQKEFSSDPRKASMYVLISIFGYKTGMRINEILSLRLGDIQEGNFPIINIRRTQSGTTKTEAGKRRIPILPFLSTQEFNLLKTWLNKRKAEVGPTKLKEPLFCTLEAQDNKLLAAKVSQEIGRVLRKITGDESLSYHILRHSFANWVFIKLQPNLDHHCLNPSSNLYKEIAANCREWSPDAFRYSLLGNAGDGRNANFAVARLIGHATYHSTFTSYLHMTDLFLFINMAQPSALPVVSDVALKSLLKNSYLPKIEKTGWGDRRVRPLVEFVQRVTSNIEETGHFKPVLLVKAASPTKLRKRLVRDDTETPSLPAWHAALEKYQAQHGNAKGLLPSEVRSDMFLIKNCYEIARTLSAVKLAKTVNILNKVNDFYDTKLNGVRTADDKFAKEYLYAIRCLNLGSQLKVLHHKTSKKQPEVSVAKAIYSWESNLGLGNGVIVRSPASSKTKGKWRGEVTIKIVKKIKRANGSDQFVSSPGIPFLCRFLDWQYKNSVLKK